MNSTQPVRMGPVSTHPALKNLLFALGLGAVASSFASSGVALTLAGIQQGHLWELLSYPFALSARLSWEPILFLAIDLWVIWIFGSALIEQRSAKSFFLLFFSATLVGSLAALGGMMLTPSLLAGPTPIVFALLAAWARSNPKATLFAFRAAPFLLAILGIDLLIQFSRDNWTHLFANGSAALFGIFFPKISFARKSRTIQHPKIYDIRSGKPVLNDDQFMDSMLGKISRYGENALTAEEKKRMLEISEKKAKR